MPAAFSKSAVSLSGSPMVPEYLLL